MPENKAQIIIEAINKTQAALAEVKGGFEQIKKSVSGFTDLYFAGKAAYESVGWVVEGIKSFIDAAAEAEQIEKRMAFQIGAASYEYEKIKAAIDGYADSVQRTTRFEDDLARQGLGQMMQYTHNLTKAMGAVDLAMDMSVQTGMDLQSSIRYIGMAVNGNVEILGRWIPELRDIEQKLGANATAAEKWAYTQEVLNQKFGGAAQKDLESYAAKVAQLKNLWGDIKEEHGGTLINIIGSSMEGWKTILDLLSGKGQFEDYDTMMKRLKGQRAAAVELHIESKRKEAAETFKIAEEQRKKQYEFDQEWDTKTLDLKEDEYGKLAAMRDKDVAAAKKAGMDVYSVLFFYTQMELNLNRKKEIEKLAIEKEYVSIYIGSLEQQYAMSKAILEKEKNTAIKIAIEEGEKVAEIRRLYGAKEVALDRKYADESNQIWLSYYQTRINKINEVAEILSGMEIESELGPMLEFQKLKEQWAKILSGPFTKEQLDEFQKQFTEAADKIKEKWAKPFGWFTEEVSREIIQGQGSILDAWAGGGQPFESVIENTYYVPMDKFTSKIHDMTEKTKDDINTLRTDLEAGVSTPGQKVYLDDSEIRKAIDDTFKLYNWLKDLTDEEYKIQVKIVGYPSEKPIMEKTEEISAPGPATEEPYYVPMANFTSTGQDMINKTIEDLKNMRTEMETTFAQPGPKIYLDDSEIRKTIKEIYGGFEGISGYIENLKPKFNLANINEQLKSYQDMVPKNWVPNLRNPYQGYNPIFAEPQIASLQKQKNLLPEAQQASPTGGYGGSGAGAGFSINIGTIYALGRTMEEFAENLDSALADGIEKKRSKIPHILGLD